MAKHTGAVRDAKIQRHAEIVADANDLKANSEYGVKEVRRAERDAMNEMAEDHDHPDDVDAIALPSERLE